jgi:hypothetical protein
MRLALLILLGLFPAIAFAGPVVILGFATTWLAVAQVVLTIGMMVYGAAQQKKAEKKAQRAADAQKAEYNANLKDRTITSIAVENPHTYAYGKVRVGSSIVGMFSSGSRDEYKHLVCVHAAHECEAIEEVYINGVALGLLDIDGFVTSGQYFRIDTINVAAMQVMGSGPVTLNSNYIPSSVTCVGRVTGSEGGYEFTATSFSVVDNVLTAFATDGRTLTDFDLSYQYTQEYSAVRVKKHLGSMSDPADATLMADVPSKWFSTSVLRGFCYTVIRLDLNQSEFQGGIPNIEVLLKGKKLYDFRTDTTAWSDNPVLATYDYLTSELCGVGAADLPLSKFITAANVCDEAFSFGKRYTLNGTVTSNQSQAQVLEQFAQAMAGSIVSTNWSIRAGKYTAPVLALQQEDIVGSIAVTPGMSDSDTYNSVRGQYISSENQYVSTDYVPYQNANFLALDGREIWSDIDLPYTDNLQRVHNLCRIFTEKNRNAYTVKAEFSLKAWAAQVGDRVTLNSPYFGWVNKVFEVTDKKFSPTSAVELTLKEDAEGIWDFADQVVNDATPNTNLPNPFIISKIASVSCESGENILQLGESGTLISRILVTWPTQTVKMGSSIEVEWQMLGSDVWEKTSVTGEQTQAYLGPVLDSAFYTVRARNVDPYFNVKSDWTYATLHQVVGKTMPPPDITDLTISGSIMNWTPVSAIDLKGYIFRFQYGTSLDWNSATPLHQGIITEMPYDLVTRPSGVVVIMGKAVDTSGNESLATANIFTDLGDAPIQNVVETIDLDALAYPGTISGGSVVGGDIVADNLDSFYGTGTQSFYGAELDPFYDASTFAQVTYTTDNTTITSALAGSLMTLQVDTQGVDLVIEYRFPDSTPFYDADGASFYGADVDPFYAGVQGAWIPWPGQVVAKNDVYQFRVTLGAGTTQGVISTMSIIIDAPDIVEYIDDLAISSLGTTIPYTKVFNVIKNVQATLQSNASGAETIEIDKTVNLIPKIKAYNSSHTAVSGATSDITIRGY